MNTPENDKLIAQFMGLHQNKHGHWCNMEDLTIIDGNEFATEWIRAFQYNTSWDWLIPVIKKLSSLELEQVLVNNSVKTYIDKRGQVMRALLALNIGRAYKEVVAFIQWYNALQEANKQ